jgi:hypothetical protein
MMLAGMQLSEDNGHLIEETDIIFVYYAITMVSVSIILSTCLEKSRMFLFCGMIICQ